MKTMRIFFKAMMVMAFAFVTLNSVNAQSLKDGKNMSEAQIAQFLTTNPKDTVKVFVSETFANDTLCVTTRLYYKDREKFVTRLHKDKSVQNSEMMSALVKASVDTRFEEALYDSRRRDVYYYHAEGLPGVMGADRHAGKIVAKAANKYGWSFQFFAGGQFAEHIIAPLGGVGVRFTQPIWMVGLTAELGQSKTSDMAQAPTEKYLTSRTEVALGFQPFRFDKFNQHRLFFGAKLGWEWYKTDTPADKEGNYFRSEGNYLYPSVFLRYEYRMFATGNSWFAELSCSRKQYVVQEEWSDGVMIKSGETRPMVSVELKVGFDLGFGRDKVKNASWKQLRRY